jgi:hypothetical protein
MASTPRTYSPTAQTTIVPDETITLSIVEAIADARATEPTAVDVQLSDHVDLDALETLYSHSNANETSTWKVQFTVDEFQVTVESSGQITVV